MPTGSVMPRRRAAASSSGRRMAVLPTRTSRSGSDVGELLDGRQDERSSRGIAIRPGHWEGQFISRPTVRVWRLGIKAVEGMVSWACPLVAVWARSGSL